MHGDQRFASVNWFSQKITNRHFQMRETTLQLLVIYFKSLLTRQLINQKLSPRCWGGGGGSLRDMHERTRCEGTDSKGRASDSKVLNNVRFLGSTSRKQNSIGREKERERETVLIYPLLDQLYSRPITSSGSNLIHSPRNNRFSSNAM